MKKQIDAAKAALLKKSERAEKKLAKLPKLSSGSCLLNLALTDTPHGGYPKGSHVLIVGDSAAGKTFLGLTAFAEGAQDKRFDGYRFIHDDAEGGAKMNKEKFFGAKAAARIEPPRIGKDGEPLFSDTIDEYYDVLEDILDAGKPVVYLLDSADVLSSEAEQKKIKEQKAARKANRDKAGTMTDGKAAIHSRRLRTIIPRLRKTGSILITLSQTRDSMQTFGFGPTKTRAGGRALRFYADLEFWLSIKTRLKAQVRGKKRKVGVLTKIDVKKNRVTGNEESVEVPIMKAFGVDDVAGCVDFLIDEKHWKPKPNVGLVVPEFEFKGSRDELIKFVEDGEYEKDLRDVVAGVWKEIQIASRGTRKARYA